MHVGFGAGGPQTADRVTAPIARAFAEHGFTDVRVRSGGSGIAVSGRTPG
ncbi:MAG: hypothetical protein M3513_00520 [Actinomycetota bacterium]|nr:hypothetical protein [Actinomycetota bacterium]